MKKYLKTLFALSGIAMLMTGCDVDSSSTVSISSSTGSSSPATSESTTAPGYSAIGYYDSIDDNQSGEDLRKSLQTLNTSKTKEKCASWDYQTLRALFIYSDRAIDTPENKIVGFYDNTIMNGKWDGGVTYNREHVWPKSLGGNEVENDLHMVRPTNVAINSDRGNTKYGKGYYDPGQYYTEYRGVASRIIFYCAMKSDTLANKSTTAGVLEDMLVGNLTYLPTDSDTAALGLKVEWNRNNQIAEHKQLQGNRNPFVDHPEYACKIWGSKTAATKKACGM